jgi:hypothetical protein
MGDEDRSRGYIPLINNASVIAELPEGYEKYRDPPPTATDVPVYQPFQSPAAVVPEEGTVAAKEIREKREKTAAAPPKVFKATKASDKTDRADRVTALFDSVEAVAAAAAEKPDAKGAKAALKQAAAYEEYKDDFQEKIKRRSERMGYPLVTYQEGQQENEENVEQYAKDIPVYMPSTRKAFYTFLNENYAEEFSLPNEVKDPDPKACEALMKAGPAAVEPFRYQRFIKEYIRQSSPYRGILVYHGLGSGKTCTAIAAAEALFATDKKNIIVMSPFSLKKNFLREVSKCGFRHFQLKNFLAKAVTQL